jgi:ribosomal protein S18 acetylase RimI-like enzyme
LRELRMDITIRPASEEDEGPVAELIYLAALANARVCPLDVMFKAAREQVLEKIALMFQNVEDNLYHYSRCLLTDDKVASSLYSNTTANDLMSVWRRTLGGMGHSDIEMLAMVWRMRSYYRVKPTLQRDGLVIDNVATLPEFRRKGLVHLLFGRARGFAREKGFPRMELECQVGNTAALNAYEKEGFVVAQVKTHPSWERTFGTPGVMRMRLDLDT